MDKVNFRMLRNAPPAPAGERSKGAEGYCRSANQLTTSRQPGVWEQSVGCVVQAAASQKSQCEPSRDMGKSYAMSSGARQAGAYPPGEGNRLSIQ